MDKHTNEHEYAKPEITDHGTLAELTAGSGFGTHLDATFPAGTKTTALTFSGPNP
jgi:hypothetical protein